MTTKPALQKILKGILHTEGNTNAGRKTQERINTTRQLD
jgi:hypothetical protein